MVCSGKNIANGSENHQFLAAMFRLCPRCAHKPLVRGLRLVTIFLVNVGICFRNN